MATILALDTCTEACSAALIINDQVFHEFAETPREHSQRLLPMVETLLTQAQISLSEVDVIAYGRGPGSFTGIRICTSMTQGLALGLDKPVIGISTLATMAQTAINAGATQVLATIDARMNEVYWGQYVAKDGIATLVGEERVSAPEAVSLALDADQAIVVCGTGVEAYPHLAELTGNMSIDLAARLPSATMMLPLAVAGIAQGLTTPVDELAPVYLRDTVTWKKLPGRE